ncbi:MAG: hypothetical protein JST00_34150 [Deltaproteobacteria bacterium]|nr:hypothetical protein [Deltaproteobacteria bacterium]
MDGTGGTGGTTMREARAAYFAANGFGETGGYDDPWVDFELGPIPFPFPNTKARVEAVKFHDLHHIATGYRTDIVGELEISGWEIGAGCKRMPAAWFLNLGGMGLGAFVAPARVFRAFVRGRRSESLYGERFEPLLDESVASVRARFVGAEGAPANTADVLAFALATVTGIALGLVSFALFLPLAPIGLVTNYLRKRDKTANAAPRASTPAS